MPHDHSMFGSERLKRLKKPRKTRAQSAPAFQPYHEEVTTSEDEATTSTHRSSKRLGGFHRRRTKLSHDDSSSTDFSSSSTEFATEKTYSMKPPSRGLDRAVSANTILETPVIHHPPASRQHHPLVKALVAALQKDHMLDVTLTGKEGARVRASRYVLACRCEALEKKLYTHHVNPDKPQQQELYIGDYKEVILRGLVEFCFTGELSEFTASQTPETVQNIDQLYRLGQEYRFRPLKNKLYQVSRKMMNCDPSMACVFYGVTVGDVQSYALQTLYECPQEAFRSDENISYISSKRLKSLIPRLVEEEVEAVHIIGLLTRWRKVFADNDDNAAQVARQCAARLDLSQVHHLTEDTITLLRESNLFDEETIQQVVSSAASTSKDRHTDVDRVIVNGAGDDSVNGIYYKNDLEGDCALYSKEEGASMGIHYWKGYWHICKSCDLSHSLYRCAGEEGAVPRNGWESLGVDSDSPPECIFVPREEGEPCDCEGETTPELPACFPSELDMLRN